MPYCFNKTLHHLQFAATLNGYIKSNKTRTSVKLKFSHITEYYSGVQTDRALLFSEYLATKNIWSIIFVRIANLPFSGFTELFYVPW